MLLSVLNESLAHSEPLFPSVNENDTDPALRGRVKARIPLLVCEGLRKWGVGEFVWKPWHSRTTLCAWVLGSLLGGDNGDCFGLKAVLQTPQAQPLISEHSLGTQHNWYRNGEGIPGGRKGGAGNV